MRLTNAERERRSLWPIKPFDMTDEQLAELRKAKSRHRRAIKRREKGIRTKESLYGRVGEQAEALGSMRALANEPGRDGRRRTAGAKLSRDCDATIVSKEEHQVATTERVEAPRRGLQGSEATRRRVEEGEVGEQAERQEKWCSPELRLHTTTSLATFRVRRYGRNSATSAKSIAACRASFTASGVAPRRTLVELVASLNQIAQQPMG